MRSRKFAAKRTLRSEAGQAMLFALLGLGVFLIGAMALAIDMGNLYFSRQAAQTAADAACTAGAMDMLVGATNGTLPANAGFTLGTNYSCATTDKGSAPTSSPCQYAALNGFNSSVTQSDASSGVLGNNVSVSFPSSGSYTNFTNFPPSSVTGNPLIQVTITNNIPTFFAGMLQGLRKQTITAGSLCGVIQATSPIPILVLHPTKSGSLLMNGGGSNSSTTCKNPLCGDIVIAGGPSRSIQVNSSSATAATFKGGPAINLCPGGNNYCGSNMGVWGSESGPGGTNFWSTSTCSVKTVNNLCSGTQTDPQFNSPSAPIADPFASTTAPGQPTFATFTGGTNKPSTGTSGIVYKTDGCPDPAGCHEFSPGYYPNGLDVKGFTGIFRPGLYYIGGDPTKSGVCNNGGASGSLCEETGSCMRPTSSAQPGDGSGGTVFYFADSNSVVVGGGGGSCTGVDSFDTAVGGQGLGVACTKSSVVPKNIPGSLSGSVLLAPCQTPTDATQCNPNCSLNFGDPLGTNDPNGEQRGMLFFQDRGSGSGATPTWSGNGGMLLAGTMYFHQCIIKGADTGQGCDFKTPAFNDALSLGGTAGSNTYVLGDIVVDQLNVGGNGQIVMDLNPTAAFTTLKAALLQ